MTKLRRARAGCYTGQDDRGRLLTVEYSTTGYGDSGWFFWIDSERSDFPVATKRYAVERLSATLGHINGRPLIEVLNEADDDLAAAFPEQAFSPR